MDELMSLPQAIARMEGFYQLGSRPNRNNNPGDLEYGEFARGHGAIGTDGRFAIFPDSEVGFAALSSLLASHGYRNLTLSQAISRYAPGDENDTQHYINMVSEWTGIKPDEKLPLVAVPEGIWGTA